MTAKTSAFTFEDAVTEMGRCRLGHQRIALSDQRAPIDANGGLSSTGLENGDTSPPRPSIAGPISRISARAKWP